jgi:type I restriction enzyme R subunit
VYDRQAGGTRLKAMMSTEFLPFDPDGELTISYGNLPHWQQPGATYFLTFRTYDSIPASVLQEWRHERDRWLRRHGIDPGDRQWRTKVNKIDKADRSAFQRAFSKKYHSMLDECRGSCVLRRPELARLVADSLLYFDGTRYDMGDFVVMPNHVHLLVRLLGETDLRKQYRSWTHYSAREINRALGRKGRFWQEEGFDHLVRKADQREYLQRYIADNPKKARLREGEFLHYRPPRGDQFRLE